MLESLTKVLLSVFYSISDMLINTSSTYNPFAWDYPLPHTGRYSEIYYNSIRFFSDFTSVSHYLTFGIGGVFSFTLLFLVLFKTTGPLANYGRMLLLCCACDVNFWAVEMLVQLVGKLINF